MRSLLIVLLVACGGSDKSDDSSDPTTTSTATTTSTTTSTTSTTTSTTTPTTSGWIDAVIDTWCAPQDRIAQIEVGEGTVFGVVMDQTDPWLQAPVSSTAHCDHHTFTRPDCGNTCASDEICDLSATCIPSPQRALDAVLTARQGTDTEVFNTNQSSGDLWGYLDMTGAHSIELEWNGLQVRSPMMERPAGLTGFLMTVSGDWDAPGDTTLTWHSTTDWAYTLIPINHHVGGPTFTECHVPGSASPIVVPAAMMDPLAVITGLEFQGMRHAQFASAQTAAGCVEFRFLR